MAEYARRQAAVDVIRAAAEEMIRKLDQWPYHYENAGRFVVHVNLDCITEPKIQTGTIGGTYEVNYPVHVTKYGSVRAKEDKH